MINPGSTQISVANQDVRGFGQPFRWFRLRNIPAGATITMRTVQEGNTSAFFNITQDDWIEAGETIIDCFFRSTIAGLITYEWSLLDVIKSAGSTTVSIPGNVNATIVSPLNSAGQVAVGGFQPYSHAGPLTDYNDPLYMALLQDTAGIKTSSPMSTWDFSSLAVQPGVAQVPAFLFTAGQVLDVKGYAWIKMQVNVTAAGPLTFVDDYGNLIPVFNADTGENEGLGLNAAALSNTGYYIPTTGCKTITITAPGAWSLWCTFSISDYIPLNLKPANAGAFNTNQKNVAVAGTGEALVTFGQLTRRQNEITVRAKPANTGNIWVGSTKLNSQNHAIAWQLKPGEAVGLAVSNASLIWIDADIAGEGVLYISELA